MNRPIRLGVLLSAGGSTLQNLLDRGRDGRLPAALAVVVSNNPDAYGLTRAARAGIPGHVVRRRDCPDLAEFSRRIFEPCRAAGVDLVCMGGFLQLVSIPDDFAGRVLNIHPSLIPS